MRIQYKFLIPFMYSQKWNCTVSLFPKQNYNVLCPNSYTHISVRFIHFQDGSVYFAAAKYLDRTWEYVNVNVQIGTEAAKNSQKRIHQYIYGIFVAVTETSVCSALPFFRAITWQSWRIDQVEGLIKSAELINLKDWSSLKNWSSWRIDHVWKIDQIKELIMLRHS